MTSALDSLLELIEEPDARENLIRLQAWAGLPDDDALFVLGYAMALAVRVPNSKILDEATSLADSCGTVAARLEVLASGLNISGKRMAQAGDAIAQALEPVVRNLNNCSMVVRQVAESNAATLRLWNEATAAIQRAEERIVKNATVAARVEAKKEKAGAFKMAALCGLMAGCIGSPMAFVILRMLGIL